MEKENPDKDFEPVCDDHIASKAYKELLAIVGDFNQRLDLWHRNRGCVANFAWHYAPTKRLDITGIDCIIYRKAPPTEKNMKDVLREGDPANKK